MSLRLDSSSAAYASRALLIAGLLLASASCSHQQPVATETVKPLPRRSARAEPPRPRSNDSVARREDTASAPGEPAVFFDFDSADLRPEDHAVLQQLADGFRARGTTRSRQIRIEGNCDDLGTTEYNLALGEHRARAAKTYLVHLGVPDDRIATISYGSARQKYPDDGSGRARNRRDDLIIR